jgi:hypothetical protein
MHAQSIKRTHTRIQTGATQNYKRAQDGSLDTIALLARAVIASNSSSSNSNNNNDEDTKLRSEPSRLNDYVIDVPRADAKGAAASNMYV